MMALLIAKSHAQIIIARELINKKNNKKIISD
jgi:hypothetical protein